VWALTLDLAHVAAAVMLFYSVRRPEHAYHRRVEGRHVNPLPAGFGYGARSQRHLATPDYIADLRLSCALYDQEVLGLFTAFAGLVNTFSADPDDGHLRAPACVRSLADYGGYQYPPEQARRGWCRRGIRAGASAPVGHARRAPRSPSYP
jgi:hypothetical protein